jgi:ABC-2 type transport system ATP-binding protein
MDPASTSAVISIQGLHKYYGRAHALRGLDLTVPPGSIFGFLGPNGAGKTTTIRCLLDLIRPQAGTMRVLGLDPRRDSLKIRARTGYLPGELHVQPGYTVKGALDFYNRLRKNQASWKTIHSLADRLNLDLKIAVKNLSKGNRQKLGVVLALMHQPELLLLDEPTSGLDPLIQREVLGMIREARDNGTTVFFSSHVLSEVQEIASQVAIIRKGRIVEVAGIDDLIARSLRRAVVWLKERVPLDGVDQIPGAELILIDDGITLTFRIAGDIDPLIKYLANYPVQDLFIERPSLEEVFLAYYGGEDDLEEA